MDGPIKPFLETLIETTIGTAVKHIRDVWQHQEQPLKDRLEAIKGLEHALRVQREAVATEVRYIEESTKEVREKTKQTLNFIRNSHEVDIVLPVWEDQDSLVPLGLRGLLREIRGTPRSLPSSASSLAGNVLHQNSSSPEAQPPNDEIGKEVTVRTTGASTVDPLSV